MDFAHAIHFVGSRFHPQLKSSVSLVYVTVHHRVKLAFQLKAICIGLTDSPNVTHLVNGLVILGLVIVHH
jgi:hypothetical protein